MRHLPLVEILMDTEAELQELVVASGLKVLEAMLEEDRAAVCGPRYAHQAARRAYRAGHAPSQVVLGGRKVAGTINVSVQQSDGGADPGAVGRVARDAARQPRPGRTADRWGARRQPLYRGRPGIDKSGTKHPLGLWEGATENATVCQGLLTSRGLRTDRSLLVIMGRRPSAAVTQTFGRAAVVHQVHKGRNILEHLPEAQRPWVQAILTRAYTNRHVKTATRLLQDLAVAWTPTTRVQPTCGKDSTTLTVLGLGLSERLQRSLATTNAIESLLSRTRHVKRNVKRWRGGTMVLRWVAAGVLEARGSVG